MSGGETTDRPGGWSRQEEERRDEARGNGNADQAGLGGQAE